MHGIQQSLLTSVIAVSKDHEGYTESVHVGSMGRKTGDMFPLDK